jgi:hypothetical protein
MTSTTSAKKAAGVSSPKDFNPPPDVDYTVRQALSSAPRTDKKENPVPRPTAVTRSVSADRMNESIDLHRRSTTQQGSLMVHHQSSPTMTKKIRPSPAIASPLFALVSVLATCASATFAATNRPNILWISAEDISPDLGCYGDTEAKTPTLDRFAAEGARFTRAFSISGVCAPSRSAIITGMYPTSITTHHMRSKGVPPPSPLGTSPAERPIGEIAHPGNPSSPS